ncbi:LLM class flavin-dependent oxidoreductase [Dactylosporangium sp. CA-092794]|uniref:LLM class flavin-dependent oxidoreductase n=1 Tax=Dactylosporangium sp. CA-092794 TaxID=3239929 RepID=UPI003D8F784C
MQKSIGFLSFNHWRDVPGSVVRSARDSLIQSIELAVAAEEVGVAGAFFRVHHFAEQQASPFPLLAAIAARTSRLEMGTGVIDMRYENPLYMAEEAAQTDLISGGRLQLGISRGSPETVVAGYRHFGYVPAEGQTDADMAREHTDAFLGAIEGRPVAQGDPRMGVRGGVAIQPQSETLRERVWWGSGNSSSAEWTARQGMNLMSSTLLLEEKGIPFDELQAEQIGLFRRTWEQSGWQRTPRVSVTRSVLPIIDDETRLYFGARSRRDSQDQVGVIDGFTSRFGRSFIGEPEQIVAELGKDQAVRDADTVMIAVPNQLGVDFNARLLQAVVQIGGELGW